MLAQCQEQSPSACIGKIKVIKFKHWNEWRVRVIERVRHPGAQLCFEMLPYYPRPYPRLFVRGRAICPTY